MSIKSLKGAPVAALPWTEQISINNCRNGVFSRVSLLWLLIYTSTCKYVGGGGEREWEAGREPLHLPWSYFADLWFGSFVAHNMHTKRMSRSDLNASMVWFACRLPLTSSPPEMQFDVQDKGGNWPGDQWMQLLLLQLESTTTGAPKTNLFHWSSCCSFVSTIEWRRGGGVYIVLVVGLIPRNQNDLSSHYT